MQTLQSFPTEQKESEPILPCSTLSSLEKHTFQVSDEIPMRPKDVEFIGLNSGEMYAEWFPAWTSEVYPFDEWCNHKRIVLLDGVFQCWNQINSIGWGNNTTSTGGKNEGSFSLKPTFASLKLSETHRGPFGKYWKLRVYFLCLNYACTVNLCRAHSVAFAHGRQHSYLWGLHLHQCVVRFYREVHLILGFRVSEGVAVMRLQI